MDHTLPPECWRSEAFAEDLCDTDPTTPQARNASLLRWWPHALLGGVPLLLATVGVVAAAWGGAA